LALEKCLKKYIIEQTKLITQKLQFVDILIITRKFKVILVINLPSQDN
jgi:hypothetical protein